MRQRTTNPDVSDDQATEVALTSSIKTWIRIAPGIVAAAGMLLSLGMCPRLDSFQTKEEAASALSLIQARLQVQEESAKTSRAEAREDYQHLNAKMDRMLELMARERPARY